MSGVRTLAVGADEGGQRLDLKPGIDISARARARRTHKNEEISVRLRWPRADVQPSRSGVHTGTPPMDT